MAISKLSKILNNFTKTLNKFDKNYKILYEHLSKLFD
jgi:hypothetical protein